MMMTLKYMGHNMLKIINKLLYKIEIGFLPIYKDGKLSHYIEYIKQINRLNGKVRIIYTYNMYHI